MSSTEVGPTSRTESARKRFVGAARSKAPKSSEDNNKLDHAETNIEDTTALVPLPGNISVRHIIPLF
jgi:hypothetical protein